MPGRVRVALTGAVTVFAIAGCASGSPDADAEPSDSPPSSSSGHDHELREVEGDSAPSVSMEVAEDTDAGWNVHVRAEDFGFTPGKVGEEAREGEGHAHLYVDDEKVARVYGPWHHLPASAVPEGEHTLSVHLSANDHSSWALDGEPISDSTMITGSGGDEGEHSHTSRDTGPADVTAEISVQDGTVSPEPGRVEVEQGQSVRLTVDSDSSDTVHLHGYDIEEPVTPDEPATLSFTADQSGLFELETHESHTLLTQVAVE
ncbi:plastocyanin [Lipingzhangella halophila]|uniref:Plastocyanin n=1 Tax=Lipingzhangella halophila TaxID=1783352 RepID=A0A7W7RHV1_9ACTN|nr:hypothetical protein [Lipingzhangella halophila]MBB4932286.1 plastocyanin [Lipingzhangella halophila]